MTSKEEVENEVAEFVSPLKVDKLKAELKRRGIDTTGKKADLVKRLQDAMVVERVQGESVSLDPENGNGDQEMDPSDVPDDSVHSTTEHQNQDSEVKSTLEEYPPESPPQKEISEQPNTSESTPTAPQIVEMERTPSMEDLDNSEVPPPDSTDKMDEDEPKSKYAEEPEEVLPPLDADTVDEEDAGQTMELAPYTYTPPEDDKLYLLDPINSDLNFQIMEGGLTAQNRQDGPLELLWAGGRANFGVKEGKFGFECRVLKLLETTIECDQVPASGVRIGWSTDRSPFLLGTGPDSYAYDCSGYIVRDRNLTSYGDMFSEGDVVTALINFENDPPETSFSKNGTELGTAHQINMGMKDALFPHISSRQFQLEVNFGATPFQHELPEGFSPLVAAEEESRIKPGERSGGEEKELLCLVGLPGSGKTRWAEKYMSNNDSRRYTHVCTELIQSLFSPDFATSQSYEEEDSPPIKSLPYKFNLFDGLCKLAATQDRHLILDTQTIFKTTQFRRMQYFDSFKRIAVIVHPFDNYLSYRQRQVAKIIPRPAVLKQMKAAFYIPEEGEIFSEVRFPELIKEKVVRSLQGEPQWAPRKDSHRRDRYPPRGGRGGRRDYYRDPRDRRGFRPGPPHHSTYRQRGYSNYYGGSPGYSRGGYQPYYNPYSGGSGYGGGQSGYYGQGGYGGGGYSDYRGGYYDRRHSGGNRGNKRARK